MGPFTILLIAAGVGQTQGLLGNQTPVTIHIDICPLSRAVDLLGKKAGISLTTDADETVYIDAKNRPIGEVLSHLSDAIGGKWSMTDKGFRLSRDPYFGSAKTVADKNYLGLSKYRDELLSCVQHPIGKDDVLALVQQRNELNEQNGKVTDDSIDKKIRLIDHIDPIFRYLGRCLASIDLRDMALLPPQGRLEYVSNPNATQKQIPATIANAVKTLAEEQKVWGPILKANYKSNNGTFMTDEQLGFIDKIQDHSWPFPISPMPWSQTRPYREKADSASMSVLCYSENAYNIEIKWFDASKKQIGSFEFSDISTWNLNKAKAPEKLKLAPSKPSPETLAIWDRQNDSPTLQKFLLDPVNNDFLWFGNHEMLEDVSKGQSKSVVACLPDFADVLYKQDLTIDKQLEGDWPNRLALRQDVNWMTFFPKDFSDHRLHRGDRKALGDYLDEIRLHKRYDIILYSRFKLGDSNMADAFLVYIAPKYCNYGSGCQTPFQSAFTKLLVILSVDQLNRLKNGQVIPYRDLHADQQSLCAQIINGARVNVETEGNADPSALNGDFLTGEGLGLTTKTEDYVFMHDGASTKAPYDDAFYEDDVSRPNQGDWGGPPPSIPKGGMKNATYDLRQTGSMTLRCYLKGKNAVIGKFQQPLPKATTTPVPFARLPIAVQNNLTKTIEFLDRIGRPPRDKTTLQGR